MNFSGIDNQTIIGKLARLPLQLIPPKTILPILQGKLKGKSWVVGSSQHGCWLGSYEYTKQLLFEAHLQEGSIVFDIGAHTGFYTLLAAVLVGNTGKVIAFEPFPRNLFYLKQHLQLNKIENVTVIDAAVAESSSEAYFDCTDSSFTGHLAETGQIKVQTVCLDQLFAEEKIPLPTHLKIDVEGAEMSVFDGARTILTQAHPTIFLATHGQNIHQQCCEFLSSLGYKLKPIDGNTLECSNEIIAEFP